MVFIQGETSGSRASLFSANAESSLERRTPGFFAAGLNTGSLPLGRTIGVNCVDTVAAFLLGTVNRMKRRESQLDMGASLDVVRAADPQ